MGRKKKKASKPWCWYPFRKTNKFFFHGMYRWLYLHIHTHKFI